MSNNSIDIPTKISNYFNDTTQLTTDAIEGLEKYISHLCFELMTEKISDFMKDMPKSFDSWFINQWMAFKAQNNDLFLSERVIDYIKKNTIKEKLSFSSNNLKKVKIDHDLLLADIIDPILSKPLSIFVNNIKTLDILKQYLVAESKKLTKVINQKDFDEEKLLSTAKQLDIIKCLIFFKDDEDRKDDQYLTYLSSSFQRLERNELHIWSNLYSNFNETSYNDPKLRLTGFAPTSSYDFSHYANHTFIKYCQDIIEGEKETTIVSNIRNREVGDQLPEPYKNLLQSVKRNNPDKFDTLYGEIIDEAVLKYTKYIAITSLIAITDTLIVKICEHFKNKGKQIPIHEHSIIRNSQRLIDLYNSLPNDKYSQWDTLENLLKQLYGTSAPFRNSIVHLDNIDFQLPSGYFENIYTFIKHLYEQLGEFMSFEEIKIDLIPTDNINKLSNDEILIINSNKDAFNNYVINQLIFANPYNFMNEFILDSTQDSLAFFIDDERKIDFLRNNWKNIYPDQDLIQTNILDLFEIYKTKLNETKLNSLSTKKYTDEEVIQSLKNININAILAKIHSQISIIINKLITDLNIVCPSYSHLIKISSSGSQTTDINEAFLNITMNSIIVEKLLLHIKLYLRKHERNINGYKKGDSYYITYKNLEIANPTSNSFFDNSALEAIHDHITGGNIDDKDEDLAILKSSLIILEKIRNQCAHGKIYDMQANYQNINKFVFFLIYRLIYIPR